MGATHDEECYKNTKADIFVRYWDPSYEGTNSLGPNWDYLVEEYFKDEPCLILAGINNNKNDHHDVFVFRASHPEFRYYKALGTNEENPK